MELFRRAISERGMVIKDFQGKIFGGANMLNHPGSKEDHVGLRNAETALQMLIASHIPVMVAHVGESGHRRLIFDTSTGEVWVRHEAADGHRMATTSGLI